MSLSFAAPFTVLDGGLSTVLEELGQHPNGLLWTASALAHDPEFGPMITEPPKFQRVDAFQENGMTLKVLGVTKPMKQWDVMGEYRRRVLPALASAGIEHVWVQGQRVWPPPTAPEPGPGQLLRHGRGTEDGRTIGS